MRQIDQMTPEELNVLKVKGMLHESRIKQLHPTLKACKCGFIGTKTEFYNHMNETVKQYTAARQFFTEHGEAVLNFDDPRLKDREPHQVTRQNIIDSL
jgi:hypothetical protein